MQQWQVLEAKENKVRAAGAHLAQVEAELDTAAGAHASKVPCHLRREERPRVTGPPRGGGAAQGRRGAADSVRMIPGFK